MDKIRKENIQEVIEMLEEVNTQVQYINMGLASKFLPHTEDFQKSDKGIKMQKELDVLDSSEFSLMK